MLLLNHDYVHEQLWKEHEAEWNEKVRRGDFIITNATLASLVSKKTSQNNKKNHKNPA